LDAASSVLGTTKQVIARRLFIWGRDVVRPMAPDTNVRTWHLASVALIQRAGYGYPGTFDSTRCRPHLLATSRRWSSRLPRSPRTHRSGPKRWSGLV
jgi:hypothetical protein